ncbi:Type II secretion system protein J precursor [Sulfitobacter sp. THAF37]|uniref:type II secretion system protein GspJ n=1 Tax=Sulfitobacter sp. THAF37 TaxID=2587855 RepID=UPI0012A88640|nr:type II secretion system protein GspJ [Sulfitobacter sp. THAF37]QFT58116.1 Type II secretion system protein J precursor [Sulfitobacter sp. THAF37]
MTHRPAPRDAGITLIEMLVALAIFALVGLASFTTLDTILKVRDRTDNRLERLAQIDRALVVFSRDLQQADPLGLTLQDGVLRTEMSQGLRYRAYRSMDGALVRETGARFDDAPKQQTLFAPLQAASFRVLSASGTWSDIWPVENGIYPKGVELTLTVEREPERTVLRLVALPQVVLP